MNRNVATILAIILVILGIIGYGSVFSVHETQQALVLQFGNPVKAVQESGLNFKTPFVQDVQFMEKRILDFDAPPVEAVAADKKRIVVDAYARFRIADPLKFYQTVNNEVTARNRLAPLINSSLRNAIGRVKLEQMLSGERGKLMHEIRGLVNTEALKLGIEIVDVRIKRADLPAANSQAVFDLMRAERKRIAPRSAPKGRSVARRLPPMRIACGPFYWPMRKNHRRSFAVKVMPCETKSSPMLIPRIRSSLPFIAPCKPIVRR